jgi:hypothetical protein
MPDETEAGFTADGLERYLEGLDLEFRRKWADVWRRIESGGLDPDKQSQLERDLLELEREYGRARDEAQSKGKYKLF